MARLGVPPPFDLESFVFWKGDIASDFVSALVQAADRGIRVRLLLDAVGCMPMAEEDREHLRSSGVDFVVFRPVARWKFWQVNHRTHRKILVCDDVAYTGGVGIAREWEGDANSPDQWRETQFRIRGPAVELLRGAFLEHWIEAVEYLDPDHLEDTLTPPPPRDLPREEAGSARAQLFRSGPGVGWSDVEIVLHALIANARERLRITTTYFVPDDTLVGLLCSAAQRGVAVELLNPGRHTDHRSAQLAGEDVYATLLNAGVRIHRYQPTMLHTKVITVDRCLSLIGSANFNHRSLRKDDEICLTVLDADLAAALDADFERDRSKSREVDASEEWDERSLAQRVAEWGARFIRSEL